MTLAVKLPALLGRVDVSLKDRFLHQYKGDFCLPSLNTYFRSVLTSAPIKTLDERSCLLDELEHDIWLDYFQDHVLPTITRFNLI